MTEYTTQEYTDTQKELIKGYIQTAMPELIEFIENIDQIVPEIKELMVNNTKSIHLYLIERIENGK